MKHAKVPLSLCFIFAHVILSLESRFKRLEEFKQPDQLSSRVNGEKIYVNARVSNPKSLGSILNA